MATLECILVDEKDVMVGTEEKMRVHELGLLHRAFSLFLFRLVQGNLETLLQQRAACKYHSPLLWSNTCCGHPKVGISIEECVHERLKEEMGMEAKLTAVGSFHYKTAVSDSLIENEIDHLFIGVATSEPKLNPEEVSEYRWVSWEALSTELTENPDLFTLWLPLAREALTKTLDSHSLISCIKSNFYSKIP